VKENKEYFSIFRNILFSSRPEKSKMQAYKLEHHVASYNIAMWHADLFLLLKNTSRI
jgi:hypothetical protein